MAYPLYTTAVSLRSHQVREPCMNFSLVSLFLIPLVALSSLAQARDFERPLKRGQGHHRRGNENSQQVTQIEVGTPVYAGNGCPQGTMQLMFSPDYLSFTVLFDQFIAEVGNGSSDKKINMSCDAIVPIQAPPGLQMQITRVYFLGFTSLSERARSTLHSVFNFRGAKGDGDRLNLRYQFQGPLNEDFVLTSDANEGGETETSPCGGTFHLRILNQLRVAGNGPESSAILALDSVDGATETVYYVNWRTCQQGKQKENRNEHRNESRKENRRKDRGSMSSKLFFSGTHERNY